MKRKKSKCEGIVFFYSTNYICTDCKDDFETAKANLNLSLK